jgi:hypothetical protein
MAVCNFHVMCLKTDSVPHGASRYFGSRFIRLWCSSHHRIFRCRLGWGAENVMSLRCKIGQCRTLRGARSNAGVHLSCALYHAAIQRIGSGSVVRGTGILSEVDSSSNSQDGALRTTITASPRLPAHRLTAPHSGLERSDFVLWLITPLGRWSGIGAQRSWAARVWGGTDPKPTLGRRDSGIYVTTIRH